jgi:hypothetical protein
VGKEDGLATLTEKPVLSVDTLAGDGCVTVRAVGGKPHSIPPVLLELAPSPRTPAFYIANSLPEMKILIFQVLRGGMLFKTPMRWVVFYPMNEKEFLLWGGKGSRWQREYEIYYTLGVERPTIFSSFQDVFSKGSTAR